MDRLRDQPLVTERPQSKSKRLRGPFPQSRGSGPCRKWPALGQACSFDQLYEPWLFMEAGPRPLLPGLCLVTGTRDISSPRRVCRPGSWPHFLQPGPCPASWPPPLGTGLGGPLRPNPLVEEPPCRLSANAEQAGPTSRPSPWPCWPSDAHTPSSCHAAAPRHLLRGLPDHPGRSSPHPRHPLAQP